MTETIDQQFVEYIVKALVGNPEAVSITRTIDEKGVLLELTVDPTDLGRVIGRNGTTAKSIRTLLRALGVKNDARYNLKIIDTNRDAQSTAPASDDTAAVAPDDTGTTADIADEELAREEAHEAEDKSDQDEQPAAAAQAENDDNRLSRERQAIQDLTDLDI